jgi:HTH-type transcriptional regulator/antitoxin HipB
MQTPIRTTGELGPLLKRLRKTKNWSQTELGRRIGLSQERISAIENHPENVTLDNLLTLMMALEVHFSVVEKAPATSTTATVDGTQKNEDW